MTDFFKMMQQAQQMQGRLEQMQAELQRLTVVGSAAGGMVTAEADGKGEVRRVTIDPSVVRPSDVELLEDLVVAAIVDAQKKAAEAARLELTKLTGGMNLPFPLPV